MLCIAFIKSYLVAVGTLWEPRAPLFVPLFTWLNQSLFSCPTPPALRVQDNKDTAGNHRRQTMCKDRKDNPGNIGYNPKGEPGLPLLAKEKDRGCV